MRIRQLAKNGKIRALYLALGITIGLYVPNIGFNNRTNSEVEKGKQSIENRFDQSHSKLNDTSYKIEMSGSCNQLQKLYNLQERLQHVNEIEKSIPDIFPRVLHPVLHDELKKFTMEERKGLEYEIDTAKQSL